METATGQTEKAAVIDEDTKKSEEAAQKPKKRPRDDLVTFVLPDGSRHSASAAALKSFPDGLLNRLSASELTARNADGSIAISQKCDAGVFALAVAEHKHKHKCKKADYGPPLQVAVHPMALHATWDYLCLPKDLLDPVRPRPGTSLTLMVTQAALRHSMLLAQHLSTFLDAMRVTAEPLIMRGQTTMVPPQLNDGGGCRPAKAVLYIWLGDCHSMTAGTPNWDKDHLCRGETPSPLGCFPMEIFDLLSARGQLLALVETHLPDRADEISRILFRRCNSADLPTFQQFLRQDAHHLMLSARLSANETPPRPRLIAGSFALLTSLLPFAERGPRSIAAQFLVEGWRIVIHVYTDSVDPDCEDDMLVDKPAGIELPLSFSPSLHQSKRMAMGKDVRVSASIYPAEAAQYAQLEPIGLCAEILCVHNAGTRTEQSQWVRETYFKDGVSHIDNLRMAQSRVLTRDEYLARVDQAGVLEEYAPRALLRGQCDIYSAACCAEGMRAPCILHDCTAEMPWDLDYLPSAVQAHKNKSMLGADTPCFSIQFEAYKILDQPPLRIECGLHTDPVSGSFDDELCSKYGVFEISGAIPPM